MKNDDFLFEKCHFPTKPSPREVVPCADKAGSCKLWQWNSRFGVGCPLGKVRHVASVEIGILSLKLVIWGI